MIEPISPVIKLNEGNNTDSAGNKVKGQKCYMIILLSILCYFSLMTNFILTYKYKIQD